MRYLMISLIVLLLPSICAAETYKWVDEKGQFGFSDDLSKVPKKYRNSAVITDGQEQAVEVVEKSEPEKGTRKPTDGKTDPADSKKAKPLYGGKEGEAWKQDFARQKYEIKSLEDQAAGIKERIADGSKVSRGEYLTLQNTAKDFDIRITKARQKLDALTDAANRAEVPAEFR